MTRGAHSALLVAAYAAYIGAMRWIVRNATPNRPTHHTANTRKVPRARS